MNSVKRGLVTAVATAATLALGGGGVTAGPASRAPAPRAVTVQVIMGDDYYQPKVVEGVVGIMGVHYVNQGTDFHNVLLDPGPTWFTTNLDEGEDSDTQLLYAGTFTYRCTYHEEMTGTMRVQPMAPMTSGAVSDTFTIEVAAVDPALDGYTFHVQRRRNAAKWVRVADVQTPTFDFSPKKTGKYDLRVRLTDDATVGAWSPSVRIRVHD